MSNYYQSQFNRIKTPEAKQLVEEGHKYSLQVFSPCGLKTKWLNLTQEQFDKITLTMTEEATQ